jgi:hypothetical protein
VTRVVAFTPDLMDRSRLSAAAPHVVFVRTAEALEAAAPDADVVVVDLARAGVLDVVARIAAGVAVVGYGSHVDADLLAAARDAGCRDVLARSAFFADPASWLD